MQQRIIDAFSSLELPVTASSQEVKKAYRLLAKKYHPDVSTSVSGKEKFVKITAAYELLSDYFEHPLRYSVYNSYSAPTTDMTASQKRRSRAGRNDEEHIRQARERAQKRKEEEKKVIYDAYERTRTPFMKYGHLATTLLCLLINIILMIDYFSPEKYRPVQIQRIFGVENGVGLDKVTLVTTSEFEYFYADYTLLVDLPMYSGKNTRDGIISESPLLKVPKRIIVSTQPDSKNEYRIDRTIYSLFPFVNVLLGFSVLFYLIRPKVHHKTVILFYSSWFISLFGFLMVLINGTLGKIIGIMTN